jgi:hypothetical protein
MREPGRENRRCGCASRDDAAGGKPYGMLGVVGG